MLEYIIVLLLLILILSHGQAMYYKAKSEEDQGGWMDEALWWRKRFKGVWKKLIEEQDLGSDT